jgi:hypothetical protein
MEDYASHAWDQWDFAWSAAKVAKAAAHRGEISLGNVSFLVARIVAAHEAHEAARLAQIRLIDEARESLYAEIHFSPSDYQMARIAEGSARQMATDGEAEIRRLARRSAKEVVVDAMHAEAESLGLSLYCTSTKSAVYNPTYYGRHDDPDNIYCGSSCGEYVGGETVSTLYPWAVQLRDSVLAAGGDLEASARAAIYRRALTDDVRAIRSRGDCSSLHTQAGREMVARVAAMRAKAADRRKDRAFRAAGLRAEEIAQAKASAAAELRLRQIATVRRKWRVMDTQSWRARSAHNGGRCGYHPDALALFDRIWVAQRRAEALRATRQQEERQQRVECETRTAATAKANWLTGGLWAGLNKNERNQ